MNSLSFGMKHEKYEPFVVPFSSIPYIYNGSVGNLLRGSSCFAYFILDKKGKKDLMEGTLDYLFFEEECEKEMMITSKNLLEERMIITQNFFEEEFDFFTDVEFDNKEKLFVFTAFLDQLAIECFKYTGYEIPKLENYISAYKHINLLARYRDSLSIGSLEKYKSELLEVLAIHKPDAYFGIVFTAA